jgi:hypothetical protein
MRFSRVNDNDFTVNTYFEHAEKQVCERTKEEEKKTRDMMMTVMMMMMMMI